MKKILLGVVLLAALGGGAWYYQKTGKTEAAPSTPVGGAPGGGRGGRGGGGLAMTVETAPVARHDVVDYVTVVGNLIGEATVDVTPRAGGRVESVLVRMGDRVGKGQTIAKMEDRDVKEQVNQAAASLEVNKATLQQRENDLKVAKATLDRMEASFAANLISKQALEDAQARYNSSVSAVTVAKAQVAQTQARIDELNITLGNTVIVSPVDGFVGRRNLDPGAFAGTNTVIASVVDLRTVRLVANLVERDFKRVQPGVTALVEVDAFPGETFSGKVSRVSPVFDPATRTATMEIEVPNPGYRLKPGMYARVRLTADRRPNALVVPRNALADVDGQRGVFVVDQQVAHFHPVRTGIADAERVEILDGVTEGQQVVTVGALAIKDGDRVTVAGAKPPRSGGGKS
jgi:RND family efflux transporter MFP subunit